MKAHYIKNGGKPWGSGARERIYLSQRALDRLDLNIELGRAKLWFDVHKDTLLTDKWSIRAELNALNIKCKQLY